jgi:hypothetical protein
MCCASGVIELALLVQHRAEDADARQGAVGHFAILQQVSQTPSLDGALLMPQSVRPFVDVGLTVGPVAKTSHVVEPAAHSAKVMQAHAEVRAGLQDTGQSVLDHLVDLS